MQNWTFCTIYLSHLSIDASMRWWLLSGSGRAIASAKIHETW
jgi:hypothetical protein